jgi:hypothetical protein
LLFGLMAFEEFRRMNAERRGTYREYRRY